MKNYRHVDEAINLGWRTDFFGYFADPGTGKTRMALIDARLNYEAGAIDAVIVLAKNSGKTNWVIWPHMMEDPVADIDQVDRVLGTDVIKGVWISGATGQDKKCWAGFERAIADPRGKLIVVAVNYEALLSNQVFEFLCDFCKKFRTMIVADESTRIGKMGSKRTKRSLKLRSFCVKRRILSGTPILKSPLKIFSQALFLDPKAIGFTSQYAFQNHYCLQRQVHLPGRKPFNQITGFQNLDELSVRIGKWSYRKTAEECIDLPPRRFIPHRVYMTDEQSKAYSEMRKTFITEVDGQPITARIVLTQMMRLQQICGGYATTADGRSIEIVPPDRNPKIRETLDILEDAPGQSIIWCRFKAEIEALAGELRKQEISFFEFHGDIKGAEERVRIRKDFMRGERAVVIANTATGGDSIDEFKVATTSIFFSNDCDTEMRKQAEGRNFRAGMDLAKSIAVHDIWIPNTVETKIRAILKGDAVLSAQILKEQYREWL